MLGRGAHEVQQSRPIDRAAAREMAGARVEQAQFVGGNDDKAGFIESPPPGAAKHLKDLIRLEQLLDFITPIGFGGEGNAAQRKVDSRGQTHRGHDDTQLAGLGQWFDDSGPRAVAQPAVMISNPRFQQSG